MKIRDLKVGTLVKANKKSNEKYLITNEGRKCVGKVTAVDTDSNEITIEVISHAESRVVGRTYTELAPMYFDGIKLGSKLTAKDGKEFRVTLDEDGDYRVLDEKFEISEDFSGTIEGLLNKLKDKQGIKIVDFDNAEALKEGFSIEDVEVGDFIKLENGDLVIITTDTDDSDYRAFNLTKKEFTGFTSEKAGLERRMESEFGSNPVELIKADRLTFKDAE